MKFAGLFAVAGINCILVYITSFLAVGGDGSSGGIQSARIIGFGWVGATTAVAMVLYHFDREKLGDQLAIGALPIGLVVAPFVIVVGQWLTSLLPQSDAFAASCKAAGTRYLAPPAQPVRSIAFDWDPDSSAPDLNHFNVGFRGTVSDLGYVRPTYFSPIDYVETRCCVHESGRTTTGKPYIRLNQPIVDPSFAELTADALVFYRRRPVPGDPDLYQHDLSVTDRRDGKPLATLRYLLDREHGRACGTTDGDSMNEHAFVMRAIGLL